MYEDYEFDDNQTYDSRPPWLSLIVIIAIVILSLSWSRFVRAEFRIVDDAQTAIPKWKIVTDAPLPLIRNPTAAPSPSPQTANELDAEIAKLIKQRDSLKPKQPETAAPKPAVTMKSTAGLHSHRCAACGAEWWHGSESFGNANAHKCPKCGKIEYTVHRQGSSAVSRPVVELPSVKKEWPLKSPQLTESGEQQSPTLRDEYVIPTKKVAAAPKAAVRVVASSGCPGGVCPWTRRARRGR